MESRVFEHDKFIGEIIFCLDPQGKGVRGSGVQYLQLDKSYELIIQNKVFEHGEFIDDGILGSWSLG